MYIYSTCITVLGVRCTVPYYADREFWVWHLDPLKSILLYFQTGPHYRLGSSHLTAINTYMYNVYLAVISWCS